jgi:hypothetical protein
MILEDIGLILCGFFVGQISTRIAIKIRNKIENNLIISDKNRNFREILEKVNSKKSRFKTRVNNTVYIGVKLKDYGRVDVVYFLDKSENQINIFKDDKLIMTSDLVSDDLLNEVITSINKVHYHRIVDVVEILGLVFYREDFERSFGVNIEDLKKRYMNSINENVSEIDKIVNMNKSKLDIDEILDKINRVGIENLTEEEKHFLDNYNK